MALGARVGKVFVNPLAQIRDQLWGFLFSPRLYKMRHGGRGHVEREHRRRFLVAAARPVILCYQTRRIMEYGQPAHLSQVLIQ